MTPASEAIVDQAISWHLRLAGASEDDWIRFTAWLEADAEHGAAYDRIVTDDIFAAPALDLAQEGRASVVRIVEDRTRWKRRSVWMLAAGGAVAASIGAIVVTPSLSPATDSRSIVTAPGEHREITLADGTRVQLNGGTELVLVSSNSRSARLVRGQATFHVRHDPRAPFELVSGDVVLRDIGTVFDVTQEGGHLGVQVAEGAVMFRPDREAVTVQEGMSLASSDRDDRLVLRRIAPETVGGWRNNRLTFRETPMRAVAAAVSRTSGTRLSVADELAETPFTGTIRLGADKAKDVAHLAALTGTSARLDAGRWVLMPVVDAPH